MKNDLGVEQILRFTMGLADLGITGPIEITLNEYDFRALCFDSHMLSLRSYMKSTDPMDKPVYPTREEIEATEFKLHGVGGIGVTLRRKDE